ncbi:MAG: glycosyltransferase family 39 protein [Thaumarchaeota archaeon]|nr:glycosyltransferase family 39 protein [Nitrososphaerota archaeon]
MTVDRGSDSLAPKIILVFIIIAVALSTTLFFSIEKYSRSDLISAALKVKDGNFDTMLFAVRPLLLLLVYALPWNPLYFLSLISLASYLISVYLSYRFTRELYDKMSALLASSLLASNFAVILASSAPMADLPSLAAVLAIQLIILRELRGHSNNGFSWLKYGLLSGLLVLVRENVLVCVAAMCFLLLYKRLYKPLLAYSISAFLVVACWQTFASEAFGMNYLTQLSTGISLSMKYSGKPYNPFKVVGYLISGLTPQLSLLAFLGILMDDDNDRFKLIHIIGLPPLALAALWPAIYEPRVAIIALPGIIHICGYGLNRLVGKLSERPIYRVCGRNTLIILFLTANLCINIFLAYLNNGYKFSVMWRLF